MDCKAFIDTFSDVVDGAASADWVEGAEQHLSECAACRRYRAVFETGTQLLRGLPEPRLNEDFHPRLRHRLFHVADEPLESLHASSAVPGLTVLGMAILLAVVAWSPVIARPPMVELEPIVVSRPPSSRMPRPMNALPGFERSTRSWSDLSTGLWDDPRALLYEYSRLSQRYRRTSGPGTDRDR